MSSSDARRRRILQNGQNRLALITARKSNLLSEPLDNIDASPPLIPQQQFHQDFKSTSHDIYQPSVAQTEEDKFSNLMYEQPSNFSLDESLSSDRIKEESMPFLRQPQREIDPSRSFLYEDKIKEQTSSIHKVLDVALGLVNLIPIKNVTSKQVRVAVQESEFDRLFCVLTVAILVVLSYAGFWIVGSETFKGILLFRPLFLVLITNITLIIRRLLPDNQGKLKRGDKDANSLLLGVGYAWAEEAGRALELGLMLQNVMGVIFVDCSVYATVVVFGLSLFG